LLRFDGDTFRIDAREHRRIAFEERQQGIDHRANPRRIPYRLVIDDPPGVDADALVEHALQIRHGIGDETGQHGDAAVGGDGLAGDLEVVDAGQLPPRAAMLFHPAQRRNTVHRFDIQDQPMLREPGKRRGPAVGLQVRPGRVDVPAAIERLAPDQIGFGRPCHTNGEIRLAFRQVDAMEIAAQFHPQGRMSFAQRGEQRAHQDRHETRRDRDAHGALHFGLGRAHRTHGLDDGRVHRLGRGQCGATLGGPVEFAPAADDQPGTQRIFQRRKSPADGGVVHLQFARGARHRTRTGQR
jgi:hypothetical protein